MPRSAVRHSTILQPGMAPRRISLPDSTTAGHGIDVVRGETAAGLSPIAPHMVCTSQSSVEGAPRPSLCRSSLTITRARYPGCGPVFPASASWRSTRYSHATPIAAARAKGAGREIEIIVLDILGHRRTSFRAYARGDWLIPWFAAA
jgi:hypothetical protein